MKTSMAVMALLWATAAWGQANDGLSQAWKLVRENQDDKATAAFRTVIQANPKDPRPYRALGLLHYNHGDYVAALAAWTQAYALDAGSPFAHAYWEWVRMSASETGRWNDLIKIARLVLQSGTKDQTLLATARMSLHDAYRSQGNLTAAAQEAALMGHIKDWHVIGPFDNTSESGFHKALPPEKEIKSDATYPGKDDLPVRWHRLKVKSTRGWVDLDAFLDLEYDAAIYAVTYVQSPSAQKVYLKVGAEGAVKVWLNDRLVMSEDEVRYWRWDLYVAPVELQAGWNKVLVKVCGEVIHGFALRFTDLAGRRLEGLKVDAAPQSYTPAPNAESPNRETPDWDAIAAMKRLVAAEPDNLEALMCLESLYDDYDYDREAIELLESAVKRFPDCGLLRLRLGTHYQTERETEANVEIEKAAALNRFLTYAQTFAARRLQGEEKVDDAIKKVKEVIALSPRCADAYDLLSDLYADKDMQEESLAAQRKVAQVNPTAASAHVGLARTYGYMRRAKDAEREWRLAVQCDAEDMRARNALVELLLDAGRTAEALKELEAQAALEPDDPTPLMEIADVFNNARQKDKALAYCQRALALSPSHSGALRTLGELARERKDTRTAMVAFERVLALYPTDADTREKLYALRGEKSPKELVPPMDFDARIRQRPEPVDFPDKPACVVASDVVTVIYPEGARETTGRIVIAILNQQGVEQYKEYDAPDDVEKAELIKPNGARIEGESGGESIVFRNLEVGDLIDVRTRSEEDLRGLLGKEFWIEQNLGHVRAPCQITRFALVLPKDVQIQVEAHDFKEKPQVSEAGRYRIHVYQAERLPGQEPEPLMPIYDMTPWLDVTSMPSWERLVTWYADLTAAVRKPHPDVKKKAAELTKGLTDPMDKIRALYRFVRSDVNYSFVSFLQSDYVPQSPEKVMRDKQGDCKDKATLFLSLLEEIGVKGYYVLVQQPGASRTPLLPSTRFVHCLVALEQPNGWLYLDPTEQNVGFGDLLFSWQGAPCLLIKPGVKELSTIPTLPSTQSGIAWSSKAQLTAEGALTLSVEANVRGSHAVLLRTGLRLLEPQQRRDILTRGMSSNVPGIVLEDVALPNLENPDEPLRMTYKARAADYASVSSNLLTFRPPWDVRLATAALVAKPSRQFPLLFGMMGMLGTFEENMTIALPNGYQPIELPPAPQN